MAFYRDDQADIRGDSQRPPCPSLPADLSTDHGDTLAPEIPPTLRLAVVTFADYLTAVYRGDALAARRAQHELRLSHKLSLVPLPGFGWFGRWRDRL